MSTRNSINPGRGQFFSSILKNSVTKGINNLESSIQEQLDGSSISGKQKVKYPEVVIHQQTPQKFQSESLGMETLDFNQLRADIQEIKEERKENNKKFKKIQQDLELLKESQEVALKSGRKTLKEEAPRNPKLETKDLQNLKKELLKLMEEKIIKLTNHKISGLSEEVQKLRSQSSQSSQLQTINS